MKKIIIISFYELKDYLLYIKETLQQYNFSVIHYPLFRHAYDSHDKLENYKEHMNDFIKSNNVDIILWWFIDVPIDVFKFIKQNNKDKLFIMYNSDDPVNVNKELFDKAKIFDIVITPCKNTMHLYKLYSNVPCVLFGPMGYDKTLFLPISDTNIVQPEYDEFSCDISIITYNLLCDKTCYPNQVVYKKELIENVIKLCEENGYKLKLYGTPIIRELYPKYYNGEIPYYKLNFLFNFSKINIVSSPCKDTSLHVGEYTMCILGSGGLLMHDKTKDINKLLFDNVNCILYDSDDYTKLINNILNDYDKYKHIRQCASESFVNYSWDGWVINIVREIGKILFDKDIYNLLYEKDLVNGVDDNNLLDYWMDQGIKDKQICFDFNVPNNFNADEYIKKTNIKNNVKFAYWHWYQNSKNMIYFQKKQLSDINFVPEKYNIVMEDYFNIGGILNKVVNYNTKNMGLLKLNDYCNCVPNIKINEIIDKYVENIL